MNSLLSVLDNQSAEITADTLSGDVVGRSVDIGVGCSVDSADARCGIVAEGNEFLAAGSLADTEVSLAS